MSAILKTLAARLFERETLITLVSLYLIATGKVKTMEEAAALIATVTSLVGGRSLVKAFGTPAAQ